MASLAYQVTGFAYQGAGLFAYQGSVDNTQTRGATNYKRIYRRDPISLPDSEALSRALARSIAQENRLRAAKLAAEQELERIPAIPEKQAKKSEIQKNVSKRNKISASISHYEMELSRLVTEEIGIRLRLLQKTRLNNSILLLLATEI